jgi:hypothetical protein
MLSVFRSYPAGSTIAGINGTFMSIQAAAIVLKLITESVNGAPSYEKAPGSYRYAGLGTSPSGGAFMWVVNMTRKTEKGKSQLSEQDARLLLIMSADLVALCAKLTRSFDPTARCYAALCER